MAAGDTVTVITAPRNNGEEKYQMDGVPFYTEPGGGKTPMAYQTGGSYAFVMPEHDTEISAVYKKGGGRYPGDAGGAGLPCDRGEDREQKVPFYRHRG